MYDLFNFCLQSKRGAKEGNINRARRQGVYAAYLNVTAIAVALIIACIATGSILGNRFWL